MHVEAIGSRFMTDSSIRKIIRGTSTLWLLGAAGSGIRPTELISSGVMTQNHRKKCQWKTLFFSIIPAATMSRFPTRSRAGENTETRDGCVLTTLLRPVKYLRPHLSSKRPRWWSFVIGVVSRKQRHVWSHSCVEPAFHRSEDRKIIVCPK